MAYPPVSEKPKVGEARQEYYTQSKMEPFGLNKRSRRVARGDMQVTTPDGRKLCVER